MNATLVEPLDFAEVASLPRGNGDPLIKRDLAVLGHVSVNLEVVLGHAITTVEKLFAMREGETLSLDTELDAPVALKLNDKTIAFGHLVAVDDHFGLKITHIS